MSEIKPERPNPIPYPEALWLRMISLLMALSLSVTVLLYPGRMVDAAGPLLLLMYGVAVGYIHGVGFTPKPVIFRVLFNPVVGLALMGFGFWFILDV